MRMLLIEDHEPLLRGLKRGLKDVGFAVDLAAEAITGDHKARTTDYDVIVLKQQLPDKDGLTLLQGWRREGMRVPVLVLVPRGTPDARARVLDLGADDCLSRPFQMSELFARLRALVRRCHALGDPVIRIRDLEINTAGRTVRRAGLPIRLTPREFALLQFLALHQGQVVSRSMIWEHLYDEQDESTSNVIDVYIRYLRGKIDRGFDRPLIFTRWGEGYVLDGDDEWLVANRTTPVRARRGA